MQNIFKLLLIALILFIAIQSDSYAIKLRDYKPYKYEVIFTNPVCKSYPYEKPIIANNGSLLYEKKRNAYCTLNDAAASRIETPSRATPITKTC